MINATKASDKINYLTIIQIIAMSLIVLSHSIPDRQSVPSFVTNMIVYFQQLGLSIFMWSSGFLVTSQCSIEKYGYLGFLERRAFRLLIPYVVMTLLLYFPKYMLSIYSNIEVEFNLSFFTHSLLYPREGILPHLWFLPTLMLLQIVSPIFVKLLRNNKWRLCVLLSALIIKLLPSVPNILCLNDLKGFMFYFVMGMLSVKYITKLEKYRSLILIFGGGYLFLVLTVNMNSLLWIITNICAIGLLLGISICAEEKLVFLCKYFGAYTFTIYILSLPVQNIVEILSVHLGMPWIVTVMAMFISGTLIPLFISKLVIIIEYKIKIRVLSPIIGIYNSNIGGAANGKKSK